MKNNNHKHKPVLCGPITWTDFCYINKTIKEKIEKEVIISYKDKKIKLNKNKDNIIKLINSFDNKVTFDFQEKYKIKLYDCECVITFDSVYGNFFKIIINNKASIDSNNYYKIIKKIFKKRMIVWDKKTYYNYKKNIKINKNNYTKKEIIKIIQNWINKYNLNKRKSSTIENQLSNLTNDYSELVDKYKLKIKNGLLSKNKIESQYKLNTSISIIIPTYNSISTLESTLYTINKQSLSNKEFKLLEVIIIDDGSIDQTKKILTNYNRYKFHLKYFKQPNSGRAIARNMGGNIASGDIIIFIDSDILLEKHFVREHGLRNQILKNGLFVSFRENIDLTDEDMGGFINKEIRPNIEKDFRFKTISLKRWSRISRLDISIKEREVKLLQETNNFKEFGMGKILEAWDLPAMFLTCSVSLRKKEFIKIGGISGFFNGWGMEDSFLGACLLSNKNYLIPVFSTGIFHIRHKSRSHSNNKQMQEFEKNIKLYNKLIKRELSKIVLINE